MSILDDIKAAGYRVGNCQALLYDRRRTDIFPDGYIGKLYSLCLESGRRNPRALLDAVFGGNPESTFDGVVPFLAQRPVVIVGRWEGETFHEGGFAFPVVFCGTAQTERACFAGYGFMRWTWGTEEIDTMAVLGLAMLFQEFNLSALHGTRFPENALTKRFTERFGFRQVGEIPKYQLRGDRLVPAVVTTLLREDFERIAAERLSARHESKPVKQQETHLEDSQMARLSRGEINAIWIPAGSSYMPEVPQGMKSAIVDGNFAGDGVWIYNPARLTEIEIWVAAGNGEHEALLAPAVKPPLEPSKRITLQAFRDGVYAGEATVPATAEAVRAIEAAFPGCEIRVKKDDDPQPDPQPEPKKRGTNGGKARAAKLSPEQRKEIARKAAQKRWSKGDESNGQPDLS